MSSRHILTAPAWPYANGPRHIGHVSGFGVPCDMFSRYQRMAGNKVLMVSGTDEHGTPIQVQADKEGVTARELADRYNRVIVEDLPRPRAAYDLFTRTTTPQPLRRRPGDLPGPAKPTATSSRRPRWARSRPSTGRTLPDRYIEGTCPICGYDGARGDQCDNCGNQLDPIDLINPRSTINGETPKFVETEHFFLDLPAFAEALGVVAADARRGSGGPTSQVHAATCSTTCSRGRSAATSTGACRCRCRAGRDRPDKRLYVWFDAVIGYLSASIEWARRSGDPDAWRAWWQDAGRRSPTTSWARTTSSSTPRSGRRMLLGYNGEGDKGGEPGLARPAQPAHRGRLQRVPDDGGAQVLLLAQRRDLRARLPGALRRRRAALLHRGGRAGEPGHRLHLGGVRPPQQRRARRRLGQPGQPLGLVRGQEHRRRSRPRAT